MLFDIFYKLEDVWKIKKEYFLPFLHSDNSGSAHISLWEHENDHQTWTGTNWC